MSVVAHLGFEGFTLREGSPQIKLLAKVPSVGLGEEEKQDRQHGEKEEEAQNHHGE